jgi:hypothetical protein
MNTAPIAIAKLLAKGIVHLGTGSIVSAIIKNNITPETTIQKVTVPASAFILGAIISDAAKDYTDNFIDETVDMFKKVKNMGTEDEPVMEEVPPLS